MPRYKTIRLLFFIILVGLVDVYLFLPFPPLIFLVLILIYLGILIYGSIYICSNLYIKTFCLKKTEEKIIALSFDDGPAKDITSDLLSMLKKHNVQATFFCAGKNIKENMDMLKRMDEEGHIIGNHSYTHHFWFDIFSTRKVIKEIKDTGDLIFEIIGKKPIFFRPPYGVTNPNITKALKKLNYQSIGWSVRSLDTTKATEEVLSRIKSKLKPGAILLFHDKKPEIVKIIDAFITYAKKQGYKFLNIDELLNIQAYD